MFSPQTFDFLFENYLQNDKVWFNEHKSEYIDYVLNPLTELAVKLGPVISAVDELIVTTPKVDKVISRIYRDIRFSKDKMFFRDSMWLSFKRDKKIFIQYPEFFFVVMRDEFFYGCGYYAPTSEAVNKIRELILARDPMFLKAKEAHESDCNFILSGDMYKKSRYPQEPEDIRQWLDRKSISVMVKSRDFTRLYSAGLADELISAYKKMAPIYDFLVLAESKKHDGN